MVSIVEKNDVEKRGFRGVNGTIPIFEDKKTGKNDINVYFYDMDEEESVLMHVFAILTRKRVY